MMASLLFCSLCVLSRVVWVLGVCVLLWLEGGSVILAADTIRPCSQWTQFPQWLQSPNLDVIFSIVNSLQFVYALLDQE